MAAGLCIEWMQSSSRRSFAYQGPTTLRGRQAQTSKCVRPAGHPGLREQTPSASAIAEGPSRLPIAHRSLCDLDCRRCSDRLRQALKARPRTSGRPPSVALRSRHAAHRLARPTGQLRRLSRIRAPKQPCRTTPASLCTPARRSVRSIDEALRSCPPAATPRTSTARSRHRRSRARCPTCRPRCRHHAARERQLTIRGEVPARSDSPCPFGTRQPGRRTTGSPWQVWWACAIVSPCPADGVGAFALSTASALTVRLLRAHRELGPRTGTHHRRRLRLIRHRESPPSTSLPRRIRS